MITADVLLVISAATIRIARKKRAPAGCWRFSPSPECAIWLISRKRTRRRKARARIWHEGNEFNCARGEAFVLGLAVAFSLTTTRRHPARCVGRKHRLRGA